MAHVLGAGWGVVITVAHVRISVLGLDVGNDVADVSKEITNPQLTP